MESYYGFYEVGYIEYYWYLLFSLYYRFLEYPIMIRACAIILTILFIIVMTSCIVLLVRVYMVARHKRKIEDARIRYLDVLKKILQSHEDLSAEQVRDMIVERRARHKSSKFTKNELNIFIILLKEKIQEYHKKQINVNNYTQILTVLNIAGWLEDTIEKKGVYKCINAFNTAQILDCPLRGSVSTRFAYHKNKQLRNVARATYAFTNKNDPFRYIEAEREFIFSDSDAPSMHDMLVYRSEKGLFMPNFIEWMKLDQPTNKLRLFCIDEIVHFNRADLSKDLYEYMMSTPDPIVKGKAIRALGKFGYTKMEDDICAMYYSSQGYMRVSILVALRELGLRGTKVVKFIKEAYSVSVREKVLMTALDALYNCGDEGREAFMELEQAAAPEEKIRFAHIMNPITNDRAYER